MIDYVANFDTTYVSGVPTKNHPNMYSFIREIQKEPGDTEIAVVELSLGCKLKAAPEMGGIPRKTAKNSA